MTCAALTLGSIKPVGEPRRLALVVAGASKAAFVGLVLAHGERYLSGVGIAVAIDAFWVVIFALYLLFGRRAA